MRPPCLRSRVGLVRSGLVDSFLATYTDLTVFLCAKPSPLGVLTPRLWDVCSACKLSTNLEVGQIHGAMVISDKYKEDGKTLKSLFALSKLWIREGVAQVPCLKIKECVNPLVQMPKGHWDPENGGLGHAPEEVVDWCARDQRQPCSLD